MGADKVALIHGRCRGVVLRRGNRCFLRKSLWAQSQRNKMLGAVTPVGGVAFLAGWLLLALAVLKTRHR